MCWSSMYVRVSLNILSITSLEIYMICMAFLYPADFGGGP